MYQVDWRKLYMTCTNRNKSRVDDTSAALQPQALLHRMATATKESALCCASANARHISRDASLVPRGPVGSRHKARNSNMTKELAHLFRCPPRPTTDPEPLKTFRPPCHAPSPLRLGAGHPTMVSTMVPGSWSHRHSGTVCRPRAPPCSRVSGCLDR